MAEDVLDRYLGQINEAAVGRDKHLRGACGGEQKKVVKERETRGGGVLLLG